MAADPKAQPKAHPGARRARGSACLAVAAALAAIAAGASIAPRAHAQAAAPPAPVALSGEPLYATGARAKPTLTLALSVEEPTVGAQYLSGVLNATSDDTYSPLDTYIGYFDAGSCYRYHDDREPARRHFERVGAAAAHECGGTGFSGNFMNWAASSAIDILRRGLTGGDRVIDEPGLTVLQRAVLSTVRPERFWNGVNFPSKVLKSGLARGAVPAALIGSHAGDVHVANCLDRIHFGTMSTTSGCNNPGDNSNLGVGPVRDGTAVLSSNAFFYARVRVCEKDGDTLADPRGTGYCQRYPSGDYKPVGNLQKYSDRLRVAVFGYLADNSPARYGGVLRAPMRFVGPRHFDNAGVEQAGTNPGLEWDTDTGVFKPNPDGQPERRSGAINYLNQFGRTGTAGAYKLYDPVAELYYESLRYIQGLPPTALAHQGLSDAMKQGFPVYTEWTDPHAGLPSDQRYTCVRNNILLIGDQNAAYDKFIPGNTLNDDHDTARPANPAGNEPDFRTPTNEVGRLEGRGNLAGTIFAPNGFFTARAGYFMAGMAYWAHTRDIRGHTWSQPDRRRPGMRVTTHVLDVNERAFSSEQAFRRGSPLFLAAKYGGFIDADDSDSFSTGDIWQKAGQPGEARTYHLASSAQEVLDGLDEIFASIAAEANSVAGGALSTSALASEATGYLYRAQFDATNWSGDVIASPLTASGSATDDGLAAPVAVGSPAWSAAAQLAARSAASRNIVAGRADRQASGAASPFAWDRIEAELQQHLGKAGPDAAPDGLGEQRLQYLRGARGQEGMRFRQRSSLLGDVANSGVVLSGRPSTALRESDYYASDFYQQAATRQPVLYVGANDGMLHAFSAATGDELFAYIPSWAGPRLALLARPTYLADGHQSFVDATPAVAEAKVGSDWKTVLVSGTGAGGQGVFALDVSQPAAFSAEDVLWEFTDADDPALGNVMGAPQILKFAVADGAGKVAYRWFAAVAGGVNNQVDDGRASGSGTPALFLLDLAHDGRSGWVENRDYFRIELPLASGAASAAGVVGFTPVLGSQGEVRQIYAGDLHGQLWRLDFPHAGLAGPSPGGDGDTQPAALRLFTAQDASGTPQPITAPPRLLRAGNNETVVAFGTGKYMEAADSANAAVQSFYAILDSGGGSARPVARSDLVQAHAAGDGTLLAAPFRWGPPGSPAGIHPGWYADFPAASERQVAAGVLYGTSLVFNSLIPQAAGGDACSGGGANAYQVEVGQGRARYTRSHVGVLAAPLVLDIGEARYSERDSVGQRTKTVLSRTVQQGTSGVSVDTALQKTLLTGRLSWRQIPNYRQLHNKASKAANAQP